MILKNACHCNWASVTCANMTRLLFSHKSETIFLKQQGKSEGFVSCEQPNNLTQTGFKSLIFSQRDLEISWMTSKNNWAPLLYYIKLCASFQNHWWIQTGVTAWKRSIRVKKKSMIFRLWWMTLKNSRAPPLCYFKLGASFHSRDFFYIWVTARKRPICVKVGDFLSHLTLKFDTWPWKIIGHLFSATSSFVHHFVAIA